MQQEVQEQHQLQQNQQEQCTQQEVQEQPPQGQSQQKQCTQQQAQEQPPQGQSQLERRQNQREQLHGITETAGAHSAAAAAAAQHQLRNAISRTPFTRVFVDISGQVSPGVNYVS